MSDPHPPTDLEGPPPLPRSGRTPAQTAGVAGILLVVALSCAVWLFAAFGNVDVPGKLKDRTFPIDAEARCKRSQDEIAALPRSLTARNGRERAAIVDRGTAILEQLVDGLRAQTPTGEPAHSLVRTWLDDWGVYLANRRDYAERLRTDDNARFYVNEADDKKQVTVGMDQFAAVNAMESCKVPGDVG